MLNGLNIFFLHAMRSATVTAVATGKHSKETLPNFLIHYKLRSHIYKFTQLTRELPIFFTPIDLVTYLQGSKSCVVPTEVPVPEKLENPKIIFPYLHFVRKQK